MSLLAAHFGAKVRLDSAELRIAKKVHFSTIERRLYNVAPSDNPAVTGSGPAIALDGWEYNTEATQLMETYEAERAPRKENLKLSQMDRHDLLKEHGASTQEMQLCAKQIKKAKAKRTETMEALSLHGKQHFLLEEKREKTKHFLLKLVGLRKHQDQEQADLWKRAQKLQTRGVARTA